MAKKKLGGGRNRGKSREEGEKEKQTFREEGEIGSKSREEGEIGSESREKGDLPPCSTPLQMEGRLTLTASYEDSRFKQMFSANDETIKIKHNEIKSVCSAAFLKCCQCFIDRF